MTVLPDPELWFRRRHHQLRKKGSLAKEIHELLVEKSSARSLSLSLSLSLLSLSLSESINTRSELNAN